ncbi:MAG: hypothetical protein LUH07_02730 [Lachnospiraceae bacterium]|nr:hypothetical protein [Lachnospiraceae bacterium]
MELIQGLYSDRQLFLEIEKPEQVCTTVEGVDSASSNDDIRRRRKAFYLRNGMLETGIDVELFGVKMELMATMPGLTFERCEPLYRSLLGPNYRSVVKPIP